jgi:hypothetical protein
MDWSKPTITSNYITFVDEVKGRDVDAITLQSNQRAALVNPPTSAVRMFRMATYPQVKFQEWDGTVFSDKVLAVEGGGTGATSFAGIGTGMGLGTMAYQNANNVNITGGFIGPMNLRGNISYPDGDFYMPRTFINMAGRSAQYCMQLNGHGPDGTGGGGLLIAAGNASGGDYCLLCHSADFTYAPLIVVRKYTQCREGFIIPVGANKYVTS